MGMNTPSPANETKSLKLEPLSGGASSVFGNKSSPLVYAHRVVDTICGGRTWSQRLDGCSHLAPRGTTDVPA